MTEGQKHARYEHMYVVVRIDENVAATRVEDLISVVSVFRDSSAASAEVARLGELAPTDSRYVLMTSRLKG